jgi:protein-S-isoprenylcysteine O-methyltransferase Ste14
MTVDDDHSGVVAPPPLVFLACLGLGLGLHWRWPHALAPSGPWRVAGPALVVAGGVLAGLAIREFLRARTSPRPDRPTTAIVRAGPFRFSRNPAYLAMLLILAGIALWMNSVAVLAMLVPLFVIIRLGVVAREERYLERKFGADYTDYKRSVRRWL